jgi:hypothetical protein
VTLPDKLSTSLAELEAVQNRWLGPIVGPKRPPYIGSWNATAMFMVALFAQPALAAAQILPKPILPPCGPIHEGLRLLHQAKMIPNGPDGSNLDDAGFEPGVLFVNNQLMADLRDQLKDCSLIDIHSGIYMLGTRHPQSRHWI